MTGSAVMNETNDQGSPADRFEALGAEIATVMRAAHDAASAIRSEADDEARRRVDAAQHEAARIGAEAEDQARRRLASVEEETERRIAEADSRVRAMLEGLISGPAKEMRAALEGVEAEKRRLEAAIDEASSWLERSLASLRDRPDVDQTAGEPNGPR